MQWKKFAEAHEKRSLILIDRLDPVILLFALRMKGQVLRRLRVHLQVPGRSSDLSALLTIKFSIFLSRLNEISGRCQKFYLFHCHSVVT